MLKYTEAVSGTQEGVDFDAHYREADGRYAVAWYLIGWEPRWEPDLVLCVDENGDEYEEETGEGEWVPDVGGRVVAVMVGDDHRTAFDVGDLVKIDEDDFCHVCGQLGCTHDGRVRA